MRASSIGFVLLLVGCVDKGDEGMFVLSNSAPTGTMCLFTGSLPPLSTTNVSFELISAATVSATTTTTEVSASITVFGSLGGGRIEAEPFNFPVEICVNNCLATNPMPM